MNLYRIYQEVNNDYDTYDSAVVAAESEGDATSIHPRGRDWSEGDDDLWQSDWCWRANVKVELIGTAKEGTARGVICASFNAG